MTSTRNQVFDQVYTTVMVQVCAEVLDLVSEQARANYLVYSNVCSQLYAPISAQVFDTIRNRMVMRGFDSAQGAGR